MRRRSFGLTIALTSFVGLGIVGTGCQESDPVRSYEVAKDPSDAPAATVPPHAPQGATSNAPAARMLAAIFTHGQRAWFFKVVGPSKPVEALATPFRDFLKTVRFAEEPTAKPTWTLPKNWKPIPGSSMRFATLHVGDGPAGLDITVTPLPLPPSDERKYVLDNVNRWRGQLGLPPVEGKDLDGVIEQFDVAGKPVTLADLSGKHAGGMGRRRPEVDPHAGLPGFGPRPQRPQAAAGPSGFDAAALQCKPPATWKPTRLGALRKASYEATDGKARVEITAMPAGGALLANVNRWRGQVKLAPVTQEVLDGQLEDISVGPLSGKFVALIGPKKNGPSQTILGAIVTVRGQTWFIKLKGDTALAEQEQQAFKSFVESIQFNKR